jgi:hypothetical protein
MKRLITLYAFTACFLFYSCSKSKTTEAGNVSSLECSADCMTKGKSGELTCKLTSPELQRRRETVIASLKTKLEEKKELKNGFAFKFPGNDQMVDELTEFIKTERECCDFFTFKLSISGDKNKTWLEMSGPDGVKDFLTRELGM